MSYTLDTSIALGTSKTGLTLAAQLIDSNLNPIGGLIYTGFSEIGNGFYFWHYTEFPDDFRGGVKFYNISDLSNVLAFTSLNPEDAETIDEIAADKSNKNNVVVNVGHSVAPNIQVTNAPPSGQIKITTGVEKV